MKKMLKGELIGLKLKVVGSENKSNIGLEGNVIDETKNMIIIGKGDKKKMLRKDQNEFEFPENGIRIEGKMLLGRPEDRIKKIK